MGDHQCIICQDLIADLGELCYLACHHYFHTTCLLNWSLVQLSCPICRAELVGCQHTNPDDGHVDLQSFTLQHPTYYHEVLQGVILTNQRLEQHNQVLVQENLLLRQEMISGPRRYLLIVRDPRQNP